MLTHTGNIYLLTRAVIHNTFRKYRVDYAFLDSTHNNAVEISSSRVVLSMITFDEMSASTGPHPASVQTNPVATLIGQRLLEHIDYLKVHPKQLLILSPFDKTFQPIAKKYFTKTNIQTNNQDLLEKALLFDSVLCHLLCPFLRYLPDSFSTISSIMQPESFFLFSTLGANLKPQPLPPKHAKHCTLPNLQHLGDLLLRSNFANPVVDKQTLSLRYTNAQLLLEDLSALGFLQSNTPTAFPHITFPAKITYELFFGIGWKK